MKEQKEIASRFLMLASAFLILMTPVFVVVPAHEAFAANKTWDDGGSSSEPGYWYDCDNWSGNTCPSSDDSITIGSGFDVFVDDFTLTSAGSLTVASGAKLEVYDMLNNHGTVQINGEIELNDHERDALDNSGTIINNGLLHGQAGANLRESSNVLNNAGATLVVDGGEGWRNNGGITNQGSLFVGGSLTNLGSIVNKCAGMIDDPEFIDGNPVVQEPCSPTSCDNPTITGTNGNDVIDGTPGIDVINGKGGDDKINGLGGNDVICGGDGKDTINGGSGSDTIFGGAGNDNISGGMGNDTLNGGSGNDSLSGNGGNDTVLGSSGNDTLSGLDGTANNDSLDGGFGTDTCNSNPDPEVNCEV
jgi:Ca2+-binding RTX toxin-like protein